MEEILKIYNDGSHFVGTKFKRVAGVTTVTKDGHTRFKPGKKLADGKIYNSKEFVSENPVRRGKHSSKDKTIKYYEDELKDIISKYSMSDYSIDKIYSLASNEFIKTFGDLVFINIKGKALVKDTKVFLKETLKKFGKNFKDRVKRFRQKAYNNSWNYFVTFTYDANIHSEESFKTKIKKKLANLHSRNKWLYMGVFERSSVGRLHFHGLFNIPEGEMIGDLISISDYSTEHHKKQTRIENTKFREQFGINDFKALKKEDITKGSVLNYILKYIGKSGEPIFYSRGIKTFLYIQLKDERDFICKYINYLSIRYILFDDCLNSSIEINVKRMNC